MVVGGSGYLGQHVLQGFSEIEFQGATQFEFDLAFTHHSTPPPQALLTAFPHLLAFHVDLKTGQGFEAISSSFGQVEFHFHSKTEKCFLFFWTLLFWISGFLTVESIN